MTAVICVLNSQYIHSSLAPWCLLAGIEQYCDSGINAEVIEGTVNEPLENAAKRIIELKPQAIGFSCYIWNITETKQLIRLVSAALPEAVIILGGPEVSFNAEEILHTEPPVRYVISGEGEKAFALLLNAIYKNEADNNIAGVSCRAGDEIFTIPPEIAEKEPPSPYTGNYFRALNGRIAYLETSRGCPYSCAFCLSSLGSARFYDLDRAKKELLLLASSGAQTVKLIDRTFNANRKRSYELFSFIIEGYGTKIPKDVCFHFEIAGDILDEETIKLLSTAPPGLVQLEIGLQSFNPETLIAVNRKTDVDLLKSNIQKLISSGNMHIHVDLIAGLPFEDLVSFSESFNTAFSLRPSMLQLGFLKLLHGCAMREKPEKYPCRYEATAPYEVIETPWLSSAELLSLHNTEDALERLYNSGRFRKTLEYLLRQNVLTPFELFSRFGKLAAAHDLNGISLDAYTALALDFFGTISGVDKITLRDMMVCDRLATNSSGKLPPALQIKDPSLKKVKRYYEGIKPSSRLGIAILYSEPSAVCADYTARNPVTGEYKLTKISLASIL